MGKLWLWLRRLPRRLIRSVTGRLAGKLILLFATIIVLSVGSLTYISYKTLENESFKSNVSGTGSNLAIVGKNLDKFLSEVDQLSLPPLQFEQLMLAIRNEENDYASQLYLEDYVRGLYYSRGDLVGVYLYLIDEQKYYYISRSDPDIRVRVAADTALKIPAAPWYRATLDNPQNRTVQTLLLGENAGYAVDARTAFMGYHRVYRSLIDRKPQAMVSFFFNTSGRNQIIGDIPIADGEQVVHVDPDNRPFYWSNAGFYQDMARGGLFRQMDEDGGRNRLDWAGPDGAKYLILYNRHQESGWKLIKAIPYSEINRAARTNRMYSYAIGLGFLIVSLLLVTVTSNAITRPLKQLSRKMSRFGDGFFDVEVEVKGHDEIARLAARFNSMVIRTNDLINERYRMKLVEKSAILKALEAEINPHFLYNALQAISTKALKNGMTDITDMVDALALTLRYSISDKDVVTLQEELRHIRQYFTLQKARFGERLIVAYELEEEAMGLLIPKLSVQSLVENAIKHGLEKVSSPVTITIAYAKRDGEHAISVADNGPGIPPDKLEQIRQSLDKEWEEQERDSIGLKNVNTRLQMIFGGEARLEIATEAGVGTEMRMVLPDRGTGLHV
ncbi:sensor histidine kinase [Cohnella caldifontis]|uniref:sensor histidine kinase n=1 Tax=Cohnella caldifontis TaxID=3027471 RepID=UPI0023EC0F07|nr:sensor histidine kinase [Cohnella sp. YIM B05605]